MGRQRRRPQAAAGGDNVARSRLARAAAAGLCVAAFAVPGCATVDSTPPLFASADLAVTLVEFRIRLNDYTEYFVATIDEAAEAVIDGTDDQLVRRNAMEFRLRATTRHLNALNQVDPVASLVDAWALCLQLRDYLRPGGVGADLFSDYQQTMIAAVDQATTEIDRVVEAVAQRPVPEARVMVDAWADENPFTTTMLVRGSTALLLAEQLESQNDSPFAALGRLQAGVDDIVAQSQRYISVMPRTIRWQSQLILHETMYDELRIGEAMANFDLLTEDLVGLTAFFESLPDDMKEELLASLIDIGPFIEAERAKIIAEVDRQRELIFAGVDAERAAIMTEIDAQIAGIDANVQQQIDEVFARIELLTNSTVEESFSETERMINLVYQRALILVLIGIAGGAGLVLLYKWRHPMRAAALAKRDHPDER